MLGPVSGLPGGTVRLVLGDIEGSTSLAERVTEHPEAIIEKLDTDESG